MAAAAALYESMIYEVRKPRLSQNQLEHTNTWCVKIVSRFGGGHHCPGHTD